MLLFLSHLQITSKLWGTWHTRVEECLDQTLANLGTDYLDCKLAIYVEISRLSSGEIFQCTSSIGPFP